MMKTINSVHNPEIKQLCSLRIKKHRLALQRCIAEGVRVCSTLYQYGYTLIQLYVTADQLNTAQTIDGTKITIISDVILKKISNTTSPSGLMGIFAIPQRPSYKTLSSGIVLSEVSDPGNMGTLIRTAAALNTKTVVCIGGVDPWSWKVIQASAGTIAAVNIFQMSWEDLVKYRRTMLLSALVVTNGMNIKTLPSQERLLIVGNEAHGIRAQWLTQCDEQITIPMPGNTESLNAAVAGSIALYVLHS